MKNKTSNVSSKLPRDAQLQTTREKDRGNWNVAGAELDADWMSWVTAQPGCDRSLGLVQLIVVSSSVYYTAYPYLIVGLLPT